MSKYKLTEGGVQDTETGACIPFADGNRHYQEYLEWLAKDNTPIPIQPDIYHEWIDDKWVLNLTKQMDAEKEILIQVKMQMILRQMAIDVLKEEGKLPINYTNRIG